MDHHIVRARTRGVTDKRIASMTGTLSGMEVTDAMIAQAVDELFDYKNCRLNQLQSLKHPSARRGCST